MTDAPGNLLRFVLLPGQRYGARDDAVRIWREVTGVAFAG